MPTRRDFFLTGAGTALALGSSRLSQLLAQNPWPQPPLALINGRIHTMDRANTVATSIVIQGDRIASLNAPIPAAARVIDLHGATVVPGLIEPHIHSVSFANRPGYHTPLENTRSIRDVQFALDARRFAVPPGQWITSMGGWHPNQWAEHRHPTLAELDEAVPDRPVFLYERFTGPCAVNSLAKKFFDQMDAASPVHPDVRKVAVSPTGAIAAAGFGQGGPSATALFYLRSAQTAADRARSTLDAMRYSAQCGLTAHLDQVLFPTPGPLHPSQILSNLDQATMFDSWIDVHKQGRALIRLQYNFINNDANPALAALKAHLANGKQFDGDDMLQTGSIGEWAAPIGSGAVWQEAQRLVAAAGWRNENSVQSLAQLQQVVEAYEAVDKLNSSIGGIKDKRWVVHHVPQVNKELLDRLQALGVGVEMAAFNWVTSNSAARPAGVQFRTILDHGIQCGIHGDGVHIAPLNPWLHIYYAVTGVNSFGQQVNPDQHLTRQEALRLFTRHNAWFLKMEDKIGTLEPGKLADLAVLDRDYFAIPDADIRNVKSALTLVNGKVVHYEPHEQTHVG